MICDKCENETIDPWIIKDLIRKTEMNLCAKCAEKYILEHEERTHDLNNEKLRIKRKKKG